MRVLVAPDSFGDTLTAVAAADAIAAGWSRARGDDEIVCAPLSDGGPGFVDVVGSRLGSMVVSTVSGPLGTPVDARWLRVDRPPPTDPHDVESPGRQLPTAYVECAQACGLHLVGPPTADTAIRAKSVGVGQLICAAIDSGVDRIVVGLGGSATTDGGAGAVAALSGVELDPSSMAFPSVADVRVARDRLAGIDLVVASDVENPLLGTGGAAHVFGPQKGADAATVDVLEARMLEWSAVLDEAAALGQAGRTSVAEMVGAGAAGGLGAALLALGGRRVAGARVISDAVGLDGLIAAADLLITGEGRFDGQTLRGKVVSAAAALARRHAVPTIVVAGQITLTPAEIADAGISRAHAIVEVAASVEHAMRDAGPLLSTLVECVARQAPTALST